MVVVVVVGATVVVVVVVGATVVVVVVVGATVVVVVVGTIVVVVVVVVVVVPCRAFRASWSRRRAAAKRDHDKRPRPPFGPVLRWMGRKIGAAETSEPLRAVLLTGWSSTIRAPRRAPGLPGGLPIGRSTT